MIDIKPKEELKTRRVLVMWDENLHKKAKSFADKKGISIGELTRLAVTQVISTKA